MDHLFLKSMRGFGLAGLIVLPATIALLATSSLGAQKRLAPTAQVPLPVLAPWHLPRNYSKNSKPSKKTKSSNSKADGNKLKKNGGKSEKPISVTTETAPPPEDVWSEEQINTSLKRCVSELAAIQARVEIAEPIRKGPCGAPAAVEVRKIGSRYPIVMAPAATLRCKMVVSLYRFIDESLQPAALEILGSPIVSFNGISTYSCRNRYGRKTGKLSEHALANALDVGHFKLANGKRVSVAGDWGPTKRDRRNADKVAEAKPGKVVKVANTVAAARPKARKTRRSLRRIPPVPVKKADALKMLDLAARRFVPPPPKPVKKITPKAKAAKPSPPSKEQRFLKRVHAEACRYFGTVLGPEANEAHRDHFHFDMAPRRRSNYCE